MSPAPRSAVVIGAGFAGLLAALRLREAGLEVTVLDRLERPGGKAALGWESFSSGPTVVTMPAVFRGVHRRLGLDAPLLSPARPTTRYSYPDGRVFAPEALAVAGGLENTLAQLSPREGRDYARLLERARRIYRGARDTFIFAPPPGPRDLARYAGRGGLDAAPGLSLARLVGSGPHLTPFWLRFATYLGADPYRAPAVLHNVAWVELGLGVRHLEGGLAAFAEQLAAWARGLGVEFLPGVTVGQLFSRGGRVRAAHTDRGLYPADLFVSAADRSLTSTWLGRGAERRERGISGFAVQLELDDDLGQAHHLLFPEDYRAEWRDIRAGRLPADPALYLHLDHRRGFLLVNAPPRPGLPVDPQDYAAMLLARLGARLPLPIGRTLALPPARYALTGEAGALYGRAPHGLTGSLRPGWRFPGLPNLAQVGGTVHPGGGVPLSMLSGWNGAGSLLGLPYDDLGGRGNEG